MKITIDDTHRVLYVETEAGTVTYNLDDPEAFALLSKLWMRSAWETKYLYTFTWLGRPIIQLPDDMFRVQEVLYRLRPDVVIETGVAHGGSLVFYASIFELLGSGRVIGIDIEIRPHNREAIEQHELAHRITLVEGDSVAEKTIEQVRKLIGKGERVLVFLDSNHSKDHVRKELEAYAPLVSRGSYIVATDGIMKDLVGSPRAGVDWSWNNPFAAAREFLLDHPEFAEEEPARVFDESQGAVVNVTQWPAAWLRRIR